MKKHIDTQTTIQPFANGVRLSINSWFRPVYGSRGGYKGQDYKDIITGITLATFDGGHDWKNPPLIKSFDTVDMAQAMAELVDSVKRVCNALGLSDEDMNIIWARINTQRQYLKTLADMRTPAETLRALKRPSPKIAA